MRARCFIAGLFVLVFYSCSKHELQADKDTVMSEPSIADRQVGRQKEVVCINADSIKNVLLRVNGVPQDTWEYQFSLEDIGTEGNEGVAYYIDGGLRKIEIDIYASMWRTQLLYIFNRTNIEVTEEVFNTYKNMELVRNSSYLIDLNGIPIGRADSSRVDMFQKLKSAVPFTLK